MPAAEMRYVPALDGLRAVAVVLVLVFHVFPDVLPGGFIGVDVFFVLSGFLITTTILNGLRQANFTFREFYLRRILRLVPNSLATIAVTLVIAYLLFPPSFARAAASHGLWAIFNASNVFVWRHVGGYWGGSAASSPFLHTWSLAVEEQFYLCFPVFVVLVPSRFRLRAVTLVTVLSFALCARGSVSHPLATFYLLPTRAWQPLAGAILAVSQFQRIGRSPSRSVLGGAIGFAGLASILAASFLVHSRALVFGISGLIAALGAVAVIHAIDAGRSPIVTMLSTRPVVAIGRWSYSIYLWHWPFIVLARQYAELSGTSQPRARLYGGLVGLLLSGVAYALVERPLRRRGDGRTRRLALTGAMAVVTTLLCAMVGRVPAGAPAALLGRPEFAGLSYCAGGIPPDDRSLFIGYADADIPPIKPHANDLWRQGGVVHAWGGGAPRVVVLGSSQAIMYGKVIDEVCRDAGLSVAFLSMAATSVFFPPWAYDPTSFPDARTLHDFDDARRGWLAAWKPDVVLLIDRWDLFAGDMPRLHAEVERLLGIVEPTTRSVVFFEEMPVLPVGEAINLREFATWYHRRHGVLPTLWDAHPAERNATNRLIAEQVTGHPDREFLRVADAFFLPGGTVRWNRDRDSLYVDDDHLSTAGTREVRERLREMLLRRAP